MRTESQLLPEEKILFQTKKHFIIFLPSILTTLACFFFLFNGNPYVVKFAFLPAIAALLCWANDSLNYITSRFAVTTKRVRMREGFLYKHISEMRLATIANITVTQSLLGQVLNYGTVIIYPFGGNADPFEQIADPNTFVKQVELQMDSLGK
jgi:uncharacterized membrane protein YdbT with pleckstrin-like domain